MYAENVLLGVKTVINAVEKNIMHLSTKRNVNQIKKDIMHGTDSDIDSS